MTDESRKILEDPRRWVPAREDGPDRAGSVGELGGTARTAIEGRSKGKETSVFYVSSRRRDDVASPSQIRLSAAAPSAAAFNSASFAILWLPLPIVEDNDAPFR